MKNGRLTEYAVYFATAAAVIWSAWRIAHAVRGDAGNMAPSAQAQASAQPNQPVGQHEHRATMMIIEGSLRPLKLATVGREPPSWVRHTGEQIKTGVIDWYRGL